MHSMMQYNLILYDVKRVNTAWPYIYAKGVKVTQHDPIYMLKG